MKTQLQLSLYVAVSCLLSGHTALADVPKKFDLSGRVGDVMVYAARDDFWSHDDQVCGRTTCWHLFLVPDHQSDITYEVSNVKVSNDCKRGTKKGFGYQKTPSNYVDLEVYTLGDDIPVVTVGTITAQLTSEAQRNQLPMLLTKKLSDEFIGRWVDTQTAGAVASIDIDGSGRYKYWSVAGTRSGICEIVTPTQIKLPSEGLLILKSGKLFGASMTKARFQKAQ
jgi:hypothetical protein